MDGWNARGRARGKEGRITTSLKFLILVYDATENHICATLPPSVSLLLMQNNADTDCSVRGTCCSSPSAPIFSLPLFSPTRVDETLITLPLLNSSCSEKRGPATTRGSWNPRYFCTRDRYSTNLISHHRCILACFDPTTGKLRKLQFIRANIRFGDLAIAC